MKSESKNEMERCAHVCHECQDACLRLIPHCLSMGGPHAARDHIVLLLDCAQICGTSHDFLHRGSTMHGETCGACAAVCDACASDCARWPEDEQMRSCAEQCRQCAESCRTMAGAAA